MLQSMFSLVTAREFAAKAHDDQMYGDVPYIAHLDEVAAIVNLAATKIPHLRVSMMMVAYLHDVLEDTEVLEEQLRRRFLANVVDAVVLMTDPPGPSRRVRKAAAAQIFATLDPREHVTHKIALIVKAADRLANVRACAREDYILLDMYFKEKEAFRDAVFRPGLCDDIWEEMEGIFVDVLSSHVG